jgi:hypothetical protein
VTRRGYHRPFGKKKGVIIPNGHRARDPAIALDLPAVVAADPAAGAD